MYAQFLNKSSKWHCNYLKFKSKIKADENEYFLLKYQISLYVICQFNSGKNCRSAKFI